MTWQFPLIVLWVTEISRNGLQNLHIAYRPMQDSRAGVYVRKKLININKKVFFHVRLLFKTEFTLAIAVNQGENRFIEAYIESTPFYLNL